MQLQAPAPQQTKRQHPPLIDQTPTYLQNFLIQQSIKLKLSQNFMFLKVVMGKYFIQAYRVFKMMPKTNSIIFWKRQENKTSYNFFTIFEDSEELKNATDGLMTEQGDRVGEMKKLIEKMTRKELKDYTISIGLAKQLKKLTFPNTVTYHQYLTTLSSTESTSISTSPAFTTQSFAPNLKKQDQQLLYQSTQQFNSLKQLMSVYMDTFANQQKGRKIYKEIDKNSGSFSVDLLLNTLNYIIFEEVHNSCYSQIEPCYWTCFESKTKQLNSDRKHIVLTGQGEICVLEIIFLKSMDTENKIEYTMMMTEFKKYYKKAKIKIYRILNEKWNGQVNKIVVDQDEKEEENGQITGLPEIIYKFDCSKNVCEHPAPATK